MYIVNIVKKVCWILSLESSKTADSFNTSPISLSYLPSYVIAVCNNVGEAAFLGQNQKFENASPQAS